MVLLEPVLESLRSLPVIVSVKLAAGCARKESKTHSALVVREPAELADEASRQVGNLVLLGLVHCVEALLVEEKPGVADPLWRRQDALWLLWRGFCASQQKFD